MTTFDNHPPIDFTNSKLLASARRDGGAYAGIGHDLYEVRCGVLFHLLHSHSSGCECQGGTDRRSFHRISTVTLPDMIAYLITCSPSWWSDELLTDLGYSGPPA